MGGGRPIARAVVIDSEGAAEAAAEGEGGKGGGWPPRVQFAMGTRTFFGLVDGAKGTALSIRFSVRADITRDRKCLGPGGVMKNRAGDVNSGRFCFSGGGLKV